jgi:hypothetical protein
MLAGGFKGIRDNGNWLVCIGRGNAKKIHVFIFSKYFLKNFILSIKTTVFRFNYGYRFYIRLMDTRTRFNLKAFQRILKVIMPQWHTTELKF